MRNRICLSHIIEKNTPSYGNRDKVFIRTNSAIKNGESANTSTWFFSNNHIGTHIDTPHHFSDQGKKTFETPINDYFFHKVYVVDIPCEEAKLIGTSDFSRPGNVLDDKTELLLIRTGFEQYRGKDKYWNDNPGLAPELADYFRSNYPRLRCVGFDFISLTSWKFRKEGRLSHKVFLCSVPAIMVIEDMSLKKIQGNIKNVIIAPLMVEDGNGGPVTVFAELDGEMSE